MPAWLRANTMRQMLIAAIASSFAGRASDNDFASRVEVIARHSLDRPNAGISIAVARDGKLILARAYRAADRSHAVDVTPDSIFHIASISKNIAAAAVLSLVDQGRVRLDDDVTRFVPAAPTHGQHVTIRQLLNHTSGDLQLHVAPRRGGERGARSHSRSDPGFDQGKSARLCARHELAVRQHGLLSGRHGCRTGHGPTLRDVYP